MMTRINFGLHASDGWQLPFETVAKCVGYNFLYAKRHFEHAFASEPEIFHDGKWITTSSENVQGKKWHIVIGCIELIPVIGHIVAWAEGFFGKNGSLPAIPIPQEKEPNPTEQKIIQQTNEPSSSQSTIPQMNKTAEMTDSEVVEPKNPEVKNIENNDLSGQTPEQKAIDNEQKIIRIQSLCRTYNARHQKEQTISATKIQSFCRMHLAQRVVEKEAEPISLKTALLQKNATNFAELTADKNAINLSVQNFSIAADSEKPEGEKNDSSCQTLEKNKIEKEQTVAATKKIQPFYLLPIETEEEKRQPSTNQLNTMLILNDDNLAEICNKMTDRSLSAMACVNKRCAVIAKKIFSGYIGSLHEKIHSFFQQVLFEDTAIFTCQIGDKDQVSLQFATTLMEADYRSSQLALDRKLSSVPKYTCNYALPSKGEIEKVGCNNSLQRSGKSNNNFLNGKMYIYVLLHNSPLNGSRQIRMVYDTIEEIAKEKLSDLIKSKS